MILSIPKTLAPHTREEGGAGFGGGLTSRASQRAVSAEGFATSGRSRPSWTSSQDCPVTVGFGAEVGLRRDPKGPGARARSFLTMIFSFCLCPSGSAVSTKLGSSGPSQRWLQRLCGAVGVQ